MSAFWKFRKGFRGQLEGELAERYTQMLSQLPTGLTVKEAREAVNEAIEICRQQARQEGTADLPPNHGDSLLRAAESGDPTASRIVDKARRGGAGDEDIREYWNIPDLQRRMMIWSESVFRASLSIHLLEQAGPCRSHEEEERIAAEVRKTFPMYGDPDDTSVTTGDDTPLPDELRPRVDRWRMKAIDEDGMEKYKRKMETYSTFNALVREEMRKGNL